MLQSAAPAAKQSRPHFLLWAVGLTWLALCLLGLWALWSYGYAAGKSGSALNQWPTGTSLTRQSDGPTLVMFIHPRCPCTRASLAELDRIVAQSGAAVKPRIVVFQPGGQDAGWDQTELVRSAAAIPGAEIFHDFDGQESRRFGVSTSGHTLLYDARGDLQFSGGITFARGHEGDNPGHSAIVSLLNDHAEGAPETPVFGCPIHPDTNSQ